MDGMDVDGVNAGQIDLERFAAEVGGRDAGEVAIAGAGTRGGAPPGVRTVHAPGGIAWFEPAEMTVCCGAGTPVDVLAATLAERGQRVGALPAGGTVGGALAAGSSALTRLGHGPLRDALLQARYVSAAGEVVKAGGPTVKNVSGFDLCRVLVGSRGTLGFIGEVILRTRPLPPVAKWYSTPSEKPSDLLARLHRPASVLWDGSTAWVLLEGHADDIAALARGSGLVECDGPPPLPAGGRWSIPPRQIGTLAGTGRYVAEVGVGIVHHEHPAPPREVDPVVRTLNERIKDELDPWHRLNPGIDLFAAGPVPSRR